MLARAREAHKEQREKEEEFRKALESEPPEFRKAADEIMEADYGSEIKLQWCWQRRGLAMDQCRLLSWEIHDAWVHQLFRTLSHPAPPGFQQVKVEQLVRADRELWTLLAQDVKGSLKPTPTGDIPFFGRHGEQIVP